MQEEDTMRPLKNIEDSKFELLLKLNLLTPLKAMQAVIPVMRKQGGGSIVNISSGTSLMVLPGLGAYSSLKRALNGLSLTANEELKNDKINVSIVYPYITDTNFYKNIIGISREAHGISSNRNMPQPDTAEYVAEKVLEAITKGSPEVFAHDWMKK